MDSRRVSFVVVGGGVALLAGYYLYRLQRRSPPTTASATYDCSPVPDTQKVKTPKSAPAEHKEEPPFASRGGTHELQGTKSYQEDRAVCCLLSGVPGAHFVAVYDGHVGEGAAAFCAQWLHQTLAATLTNTGVGDEEAALAAAFLDTNTRFISEGDNSGTTACAALYRNGTLYVANAGDSRCVLYTGGTDSKATALTIDHKPDSTAEYQRIETAGGELWDAEDGCGSRVCGPDGAMLLCSRSIGDRNFKLTDPPIVTAVPSTVQRQICEQDEFIIIASDGVWDDLNNNQACEIVSASLSRGDEPAAAAAALCEAALTAGSQDNISAAVLVLH